MKYYFVVVSVKLSDEFKTVVYELNDLQTVRNLVSDLENLEYLLLTDEVADDIFDDSLTLTYFEISKNKFENKQELHRAVKEVFKEFIYSDCLIGKIIDIKVFHGNEIEI